MIYFLIRNERMNERTNELNTIEYHWQERKKTILSCSYTYNPYPRYVNHTMKLLLLLLFSLFISFTEMCELDCMCINTPLHIHTIRQQRPHTYTCTFTHTDRAKSNETRQRIAQFTFEIGKMMILEETCDYVCVFVLRMNISISDSIKDLLSTLLKYSNVSNGTCKAP